MSAQAVTPELQRWIIEQAQAGCQPEMLLASMLGSGWSEPVATAALAEAWADPSLSQPGAALPDGAAEAAGRLASQLLPAAVPVPEPDLQANANALWAHDREVRVLLTLRSPRVVLFGGFLSDDECDALVATARPRLSRSETVVNATGGNEVNPSRTSNGMFFGRGENPLCQRIESRIAALLRWPVVNGEGLQVLHYRPGAEYKPHNDYFDPAQPGMGSVLARGGQRVGTLVMYLNTPRRGGATTFPDVALDVAPIKGNAVFFSYERAHAVSRTLHGGAPVIEGEKWVATKWLREREFN